MDWNDKEKKQTTQVKAKSNEKTITLHCKLVQVNGETVLMILPVMPQPLSLLQTCSNHLIVHPEKLIH